MHTNPFDDDAGLFSVVVNAEEQHSLWPGAAEMPVGRRIVFGGATRAQCLDHVERDWADMRPRSLREAIG
ncbi:MAG: MbtH family protein [Mycobacteriaceae bacterium]|nr:MbtH family protein [Mycobacteriaceae bacterium]